MSLIFHDKKMEDQRNLNNCFKVVLSNKVATSQMWLLQLKLIKIFHSSVTVATFEAPTSHTWLVAITLDSVDLELSIMAESSTGQCRLRAHSKRQGRDSHWFPTSHRTRRKAGPLGRKIGRE